MFEACLKKPKGKDPFFIRKTQGLSPCIYGNSKRRDPILNVLPNCVGWAVGRFNEISGESSCKWLGSTNAKNMIALARKQGLEIAAEPTLGGCLVWSGGSSGYGHVAIVEQINQDGTILTSESEWNGVVFASYKRSNGKDGNWRSGCYWMGSTYKFLGCIKNPAINEKEEEDEVTQEQFNSMMDTWLKEQKEKPADTYAVDSLQWAKDEHLINGNNSGNQMPQAFVKREDLAVILKNYDERNKK